jgi:hypothetical protein
MHKDNQPYLPVSVTPVKGSVDFNSFLDFYDTLNRVLNESGLDLQFSLLYVEAIKQEKEAEAQKKAKIYEMSNKDRQKYQIQGVEAFRCVIIRELEGYSYAKLNIALASNSVFQNFTLLSNLECIKVPSRNKLQKYVNRVSCDDLRSIHDRFNTILFKDKAFLKDLDLESGDLYLDSTCIKAQMHYPVDWVLIRDGIRTMSKAMILIRKSGVKCRMPDINSFMTKMNGLCIKMAAAKRTNDAKRKAKAVLREMKNLEKVFRKHALNHYDSFLENWAQTAYTEGRAKSILHRLKAAIDIMPKVIFQAHERIIGERSLKMSEKILSLYQDDAHILKRRKAEAHNEFGNQLLLGEQAEGFIVDFLFEQDKVSNDSKMLPGLIERFENTFNQTPTSITTDRGFSSPSNTKLLESKKIFNAICPKSPAELAEKMTDETFRKKLKRRGPNEGRVGILKNNFLRGAKKAYGFDRRNKAVHWGVLIHNLSKLTKLLVEQEKVLERQDKKAI